MYMVHTEVLLLSQISMLTINNKNDTLPFILGLQANLNVNLFFSQSRLPTSFLKSGTWRLAHAH